MSLRHTICQVAEWNSRISSETGIVVLTLSQLGRLHFKESAQLAPPIGPVTARSETLSEGKSTLVEDEMDVLRWSTCSVV